MAASRPWQHHSGSSLKTTSRGCDLQSWFARPCKKGSSSQEDSSDRRSSIFVPWIRNIQLYVGRQL